MTVRATLNLNDTVRVVLTEQGMKIAKASDYPLHYSLKGNVLETHLWAVMHAFGPSCYNGCKIPFFENKMEVIE